MKVGDIVTVKMEYRGIIRLGEIHTWGYIDATRIIIIKDLPLRKYVKVRLVRKKVVDYVPGESIEEFSGEIIIRINSWRKRMEKVMKNI